MLTEIQIDAQALRNNYRSFKRLLGPQKKIIAVVKANAYGHGLREVVSVLNEEVDAFAVDDLQELHAIRFLTEKDVYILGYVAEEDIDKLIDLKGIPVVYSERMIRAVNDRAQILGEKVELNIKIDAQLGRQGVLPNELDVLLKTIQQCGHVELRGVYAHFANIEDTSDFSHAEKQIKVFKKAIAMVHEAGFKDFETHISSTAGSMVFDKEFVDFSHVRIGLGLYGLWPSESLHTDFAHELTFEPALRWITRIAQLKTLPTHHPIGYGLTYITQGETQIAVIPQGYSDGYDRSLSNKGEVLIGGQRCPILGRVAMNMFVVDVSGIPGVKVEDEVVLLGKQGKEEITAEEIASLCGSINYEIVSRINPLLPRVLVNEV